MQRSRGVIGDVRGDLTRRARSRGLPSQGPTQVHGLSNDAQQVVVGPTSLDHGKAPERAVQSADIVHDVRLLDLAVFGLLLLGASGWGVVGLFGVDWISELFGSQSAFTRTVQTAIGLASIYTVFTIGRLLRSR